MIEFCFMNDSVLDIINRLKAIELLILEFHLGNDDSISDAGNKLKLLKSLNVSTPSLMNSFDNLFKEYFPAVSEKFERAIFPKLTLSERRKIRFLFIHGNASSLAMQLGISQESARISLYRIRKKLNLKSQLELVSFLKSAI